MHIIQNYKTNLFLTADGTWTKLKDEAMKFDTHVEALDHWNENHHIVIAFPRYEEAQDAT